ncbi:MAG: hypothetical protein IJ201_06505 [Solobacterium sp.]|nr:hypothetical protein [Solobacterium sp.]
MKKTTAWTRELGKILGMGLIVLLPVVFLCLYIRYFPMNYGDDELSYYRWNKDITNSPDTPYYSTLILGDSSANAAYLPELLSEGTINLSLGGTTPIENYYVLENWLAAHEAPKHIFLSFMDYHLLYDNMFYERTVYSHLLTPAQEKAIVKDAFTIGEDYIAVEDAWLQLFEYDHCFPNRYMPSLLNAGFTERRDVNNENYASIALHRGAYIGMTTDRYSVTKPTVYEEFKVNEIFDVYYRRLLDLTKKHGIQVTIVSLPKPENAVYTDIYRERRDGYYKGLAHDYDNVQYHTGPDHFSGAYFHDWEHFNLYGAAHWSQLMKRSYPAAFPDEPVSEQTKQGIVDYMVRMETPEGIISLADGKTAAAVVITNDTGSIISGFDDTGLSVKGRSVYVKKDSDISVTVQEANSQPNGFCIWTEPDGSCAIVSGETVYGIEINETADLSLVVVDTETHQPLVRNYIHTDEGYLGQ